MTREYNAMEIRIYDHECTRMQKQMNSNLVRLDGLES